MTDEERAEKIVPRPYVMRGDSATAVQREIAQREREYEAQIANTAAALMEERRNERAACAATVKVLVEAAVSDERERIITLIDRQNDMVNSMFDNPGRHDAFVRDIIVAIRRNA